ncbi:unnamed protein product [Arabis nemorensis]|uniref:Peptidase S8/S53 domain-containing protein n=1 Tax=Arabis nemorensis TaxID=586526 RepID=A0A565C4X9_9BRAS|nr:unnamed protein product [Arabis nemorensis]
MRNYRTSVLVVLSLVIILSGQGSFVARAGVQSKVRIVYLGEKQHDDPEFVTESHHQMLRSIPGSKEDAHDSMFSLVTDLPEVVYVVPNSFYELSTSRTWDYLGLSSANPKNLLNETNMGEQIIIGIIDTDTNSLYDQYVFVVVGVWPESEVFNDSGIGPVPSHWKGGCESGEMFNASHCNKNLIGAKDLDGHGTHVATIADGLFVTDISYKGLAGGTVRGGAPHAHIAMYKACWYVDDEGLLTCSSADILKAMDEAIHDGVDVLSLSLGSWVPLYGETDIRDTITTRAFHAVLKGITVVCAGGNSGPEAYTVTNTAPWIVTVAATTLDRSSVVKIQPSKTLVGQPVGTKVATFSSRGPNSIQSAILKPDIAAPGASILAATTTHSTFNDQGFMMMSGTSMAAPISGVVALLKALHRDWSPAAIDHVFNYSAAWRTDPFGEHIFAEGSPQKLADPFDYGGGLVNPEKAANPGLVYDLDVEDYVLYMCSVGYNDSSISQLVGNGTVWLESQTISS